MDRRSFIQTGVVGGTAALVMTQAACPGGKSISGTVMLLSGGVAELKLIYPNLPILDKIVKLATDFNADWMAGKFDSARTFFDNLDTTVQQVINDLGINASARAKLLLASVGIAVRVIASLISEQAQAQPKAAMAAQAQAPGTVNRVKQLANPVDAEKILNAVKPN